MNVDANLRGDSGCKELDATGGTAKLVPWVLITVVMIFLLSGCARIVAERVDPGDTTTKGIRYWLSEPYLLVKKPIPVYREQGIFQLMGKDLIEVCKKNCNEFDPNAIAEALSRAFALAGEQGGTTTTVTTKPPAGAGVGTAASTGGAVEVVWLPDYCHQYALRQSTVLASQKATITLADGWKLASAESDQDSTTLAGKLIDLATVMATPPVPGAAPAEVSLDTVDLMSELSGRLMIRTSEKVLIPGLYKLVGRENCSDLGVITDEHFQYETSVTWTELPPRQRPPGP